MIILDTHVLIWWLSNPEKLSSKARKVITAENDSIFVSSISIWEICMLVKKERLKLTMDINTWLEKLESVPLLRFAPVNNRIAARSVFLPEPLHADPADRMIAATALSFGKPLVTSDRRLRKYTALNCVW